MTRAILMFHCRGMQFTPIILASVTGIFLWHDSLALGYDWMPKLTRVLAQSSQLHTIRPAKGRFLVAVRQLQDPNFTRAVILLTKFGEDGAMGLIVNHSTDIKLAGLLDLEGIEKRTETIFIGGPVERSAIMLLVRSETPPVMSEKIIGDVYLSSDRTLLEQYIAGPDGDENFRLYSGYSGWAAGQLEFEIERGSWHLFKADPETVFSRHPSKVWEQWIARTNLRFARNNSFITH